MKKNIRTQVTIAFFSICSAAAFLLPLRQGVQASYVPEFTFEGRFDNYVLPVQVLDADYGPDGSQYRLVLVENQDGASIDMNPGDGVDEITMPAVEVLLLSKFTPSGEYDSTEIIFYTDDYVYIFNGFQVFGVSPFSSAAMTILDSRVVIRTAIQNSYDDEQTSVTIPTSGADDSFTNSGDADTYASVMKIVGFSLSYVEHAAFQDIITNGVAENETGSELYISGSLYDDADVDSFNSGTLSVSKVGSGGTSVADGVVIKYDQDYEPVYSRSWEGEQGVIVENIFFEDNGWYVGLEVNSDGEATYDIDASGGTRSVTFEEIDNFVQKYSSDGDLVWSFEISSNDIPVSYTGADDRMSAITVLPDGRVFFAFDTTSEAVNVGGTIFEKTADASSFPTEAYIVALSSAGESQWVKKLTPNSGNSPNEIGSIRHESYNDSLIVTVNAEREGFTYDGQSVELDFVSNQNKQNVFLFIDQYGNYLTSTQTRLLSGTASSINLIRDATVSVYSTGENTKYTYFGTFNGSSPSFDLDWNPLTSNILAPSGFDAAFITHSFVVSRDGPRPFYVEPPSAEECTATKPGQKDSIIYGVEPIGDDALRVYIAPGDQPFTHYHLVYGTKSGEYVYGALDIPADVHQMTIDIGELKSNKRYYFRAVAVNGCATSDFSNEMSGRTN